ncbi:MAG: hypothetical protein RL757_1825 [Bacteroidota bacterium]|jgi:biopolymer transport protein ExbD
MAFRKNKKKLHVSMASMTDIIFMLLIFFMLTSTLVKYFPFKLPESESRVNGSLKLTVNLEKDGGMSINGTVPIQAADLESHLRTNLSATRQATVAIAAEEGVTFDRVSYVMAVANKLKAKAVIATEPHEGQ